MSCAKPGKSTAKVVIYVLCAWFIFGAVSNLYLAFARGSTGSHLLGAAFALTIAGLGISGARTENICLLKGFSITLVVLTILGVVATIIITLVAAGAFDGGSNQDEVVPKTFWVKGLLLLYVVLGIGLAVQITAVIFGFILANLVEQEKRRGIVYSTQPAPGFHIITDASPPPYTSLKFPEPKV